MKKLLSASLAGLLATFALLLTSLDVRASHIYGMDLNYTWQHDSTYLITLVAYGDCSSGGTTAFSTLPSATPEICIYNGAATTTTATLNLAIDTSLSGREVTPVCSTDLDSTQCTNTAYTLPGIKKYTYTASYTLPSRSSYWRFIFNGDMGAGIAAAGRSGSITNLSGTAGTTVIFLVDTLNNSAGTHNTSPSLPVLPTPYYYLNFSNSYNPAGTDVDGDSLNYVLVGGNNSPNSGASACQRVGTATGYATGLSGTNPLLVTSGTFSFNEHSGQINFEPNATQRALIVYNIEEYRDGVLIGTSQREMSFVVVSDPTSPPTASISSTTATNVIVVDSSDVTTCANSGAFSFNISPRAYDPSWTVVVTSAGTPSWFTATITGNGTTTPNVAIAGNNSGITPGTYYFYLTYTDNGCPIPQTQTVPYTVTILPLPVVSAISGTDSVCVGSSVTLTDTATLGTWSSLNTSLATVSATGVVTGASAGLVQIMYKESNSCGVDSALFPMTVKPGTSAGTIVGASNVCVGTSSSFTDTVSGGTWSMVFPTIATVNSSGLVTGVADGTDTLKYTVAGYCGTVTTTKVITVTSSPSAGTITGVTSDCVGTGFTLADATTGGTWSHTNSTATSLSGTSTFTGLAAGVDTVKYTVVTSCGTAVATHIDTVIALANAGTISGPVIVCQSATITLTTTGSAGTWSSDSTRLATINSSGVVTGVNGGNDTIKYTVNNSCGASVATYPITVNPLPVPDAISGAASLCPGDTSTFSDPSAGGTWSSSNTALATVNASTGLVTGVSVGAVDISYSITNTCGTVSTGEALAINATPSAGIISGPTSVCPGATITVTSPVTGGTWSSTSTSTATVTAGGIVTGVAPGTDTIKYSVVQTCGSAVSTYVITVTAPPTAGTISGSDSVCAGLTATLTDAASGGTWSSVYTSMATVTAGGIVTGVASGIDTIKYTVTNACGTAVARYAFKVNPQPNAGVISGSSLVCLGSTITLTEPVSGGTWSSANAARATITSGGVVSGVSVGRVIISYAVTNSCGTAYDTMGVNVNPLATVSPITGTFSACQTLTSLLADATSGGTWTSSNTDVAVISSTGLVTAVNAGTTLISYSVTNVCNTATDTATFTTLPNPDAGNISGTPIVCPGTTVTVADAITTGTWSSANTSIATINSAGLITGVAPGTDSIYYTVTNSCGTSLAFTIATVNPIPVAGSISGTDTICAGTTTPLTSSGTTGGTWSSNNTSVATVSATGLMGGVSAGNATITYNVTNSCGTVATTKLVTINPLPSAGTVTGASTICPTATTTYADAISGGTWSSSNTAAATITSTGFVSGVAAGSTVISYSVTNSCGTAVATHALTLTTTVNAGVITGSTTVCAGSSITLSDTVSGGVWSVTNSNASIGAATGLLGGLVDGADTVIYTVTTSCSSAQTSYVVTVGAPASAGTITGASNVCVGNTITLSNTTTGGSWSSHNTLIATVNSSGVVGGVSSGSTTITYTLTSSCGASVTTATITVSPAPSAGTIGGGTTVCAGSTLTLTDATSGGVWSASNSNATVSTGVVTGVAAGLDTISYAVTNACATATATSVITINPLPVAGGVSGVTTLCQGNTTTFVDPSSGGTWSSSNVAAATVDAASGLVGGVAAGTTNISYTVTNSCGTASNMLALTVNPAAVSGTISGPTVVCIGNNITLTDTASGGVWSSGSPAVATITAGGVVTGLASGSDVIAYTVTNSCGTSVAHATVNVFTAPSAGSLSGSTTFCVGSSSTLTSTAAGGTWSSTTTSVATVDASGDVFGASAGTSLISYAVTTGCGSAYDTTTVTVNATATGGTISGPAVVCIGNNITLTDPVSGGVWTSGSPAVATISAGGIVTGLTSGSAIITYTVSSICGTASATYTVNVSAAPAAGAITGTTTVCAGATTTLTDPAVGGTWSSTNTAVATVDGSGNVTGVTAGSATISYTVTTACATAAATAAVTVNALPVAGTITGAANVCVGSNTTYTDASSGGTWTSANAAIATVGGATGTVGGVAAGTTTITYTVTNTCGTATTSQAITVAPHAVPGTISGTTTLCAGSTSSLSETSSGGTWTSTNTAVATVNATGGVTAVSAGTATISYTVTTACDVQAATATITVNPLPAAGTISGSSVICTGATTTLTDAASGGTWSSVTTSVATVNASGVVTGVSNGTSLISYTVTNSCGTAAATLTVTVNSVASAGTVSGPATLCTGTPSSYSSTASGGTWSSSNTAVATINASGVATAVSAGSVTFSYSVSSSCGSAFSTEAVTVTAMPIAGSITGSTPLCAGTSTTFTDAVSGGTWSSSNTAVATVGASSGSITAVSPGSATITYTVTNACGSATSTLNITVDALASGGTISGSSSVCAGTTTPLSETVAGGTWSSSNSAVATVSAAGVVTGVTAGSATISYSISGACGSAFNTFAMTVNPAPASGTISGPTGVCVGSIATLTETSTTGSWSSSNTAVATVDASGNVTGVSTGSATISYTATNSCGTSSATSSFTVSNPAVAGTITGGGVTICQGSTATLSETSAGGTWTSSNAAIATVNAGGVVTGTGAGVDTIYYTVTTSCSSALTSTTITVNPLPNAGMVSGPAGVCTGATATFTDTATGGTWSSSNTAVATVSATGVVTGVGAGTAFISYTSTNSCGTASSSSAVTVGTAPAAGTITGSPNVCIGATSTLTDAAAGGTWSSSNPSAVSVSSTGVITGVSTGTAIISYTVAASCSTAVATITASSSSFPSAGTITGPTNICIGSATTYTDTVAGGVWSSGSTAIATVNTSGVVTGVAVGAVNIYYSVTNSCGATNVTISLHVLAAPTIGAISGATSVCPGGSATLSDATSGGAWSTSDATIASVSSAGIVVGVSSGTAVISYGVTSSCGTSYVTTDFTVRPATDAGAISATTTSFCPGASTTFTPTISGGTWSSSNTAIATVSAAGVVTGVSGGTATISYTVTGLCGSATTTATVTILSGTNAGAITGPSSVCVGLTSGLGDTVTGGVWSSSNTTVATITAGGLITGVAAGSATISYSVSGGCGSAVATSTVTVTTTPYEGLITGSTSVCAGSTTTLVESVTGGTWSSASTTIATVNSTGVVTGVSGGTVIISYSVSNACGLAVATAYMTVRPLPATGTITGASSVCMGSSTTLTDTAGASAGTWTSSNTSVATISASGVVTPVATGTATISYSLTNACGTASATSAITVNDVPATAGTITGALSICPGSTLSLSDTTSGGTWSSSNTAIATVDGSGNVTAVAAGTASIVYTVTNSCGSALTTTSLTVLSGASAGSISASSTSVCRGYSFALTDGVAGGTWHTTDTLVATVSSTGEVTGVDSGSAIISYTVSGACGTGSATVLIDVYPVPSLGAIAGATSLCSGSTTTLTDALFGGTWSSSATSVATISSGGTLTGVAAGVTTITYSLTNSFGCSAMVTTTDTVNPAPVAGSISAATTTVCTGSSVNFTDGAAGGTWSSSDTTIATVTSAGVVTGVSTGSAVISYSVTNSCGTANAVVTVNVDPSPVVASITGATSMCSGSSVSLSDATSGGAWVSSDASVATVDATGLVTSVGTGVTTIYYSVTNAFGCTTAANINDTVNTIPTVTAISGPTSVCAGATATLSDATSGGTWSTTSSLATISASGTLTGVSAGALTVTYSVGTSGCGASVTYIDTVIAAPVVAGITGTTSVCAGASSTLADATASGTWSVTNTAITTVDASGNVTAITAGVDSIVYSVTNAAGCTGNAMAMFTVNAIPSAGTIAGSGNACLGANVTLTSTATGGTWSSSDASIATINPATGVITGASLGSVTVTYTVTSTAGCSSMTTMVETVHAIPVVGAISGTASVCPGLTITLSDTTAGGTWSTNDTTMATVGATTGVVTGVAAGSATINYTVTNAFGCSATATDAVTVNTGGAIDAITGTSAFCLGSSVTLADASAGGTWSSSDATIATVSSAGVVTGVAGGVVTISYTTAAGSGCPGIAVFSDTVKAVSGSLIPSSGNLTLCHGLPVNVGVSATGATSYQWYNNGTLIAGATDATYNTDSIGLYSVMVSNGTCSDVISGITVSMPVLPVIHHSSGTILYTGTFASYQWYRNGGAIAGATSSTYSYSLTGNYVVVVTDGGGCTDTSAVYVVNSHVGVAAVNVEDIRMYPNPATSIIRIEAPVKVNVTILSPDGKVIITQNDATTVDVSNLANGLYMIMMYDENNNLIKADKFIKQN